MDLQSFLQSGLIEAYVLGQVSAAERAEVERMAAAHPEVRAELAATERALEQYALANAVNPPGWMKGRILELVGREPAVPGSAPPASPPSGLVSWALAGALALALFGLWQMNTRNRDLRDSVTTLQQRTADCETRAQQNEEQRQQVAFLRHSATRQLALKDSTSTAHAYLNEQVCAISVDVATLLPPRPGKHYQFWAVVNGVPQSMGMITIDGASTWQSFPCAQGAVAYAISEEDSPQGNPKPTVVRWLAPLG